MINLRPDEKILLVLHRHWIAIAFKFAVMFLLLILPFFATTIIVPQTALEVETAIPLIHFFLIVYLMLLALGTFILWTDYYFDVWIVTTERLIDIEQHGPFRREISEFMLDKVQDITVEVPNMLSTLLKYGNVTIQTAGERSFSIKEISSIYEVKRVIMEHAHQASIRMNT